MDQIADFDLLFSINCADSVAIDDDAVKILTDCYIANNEFGCRLSKRSQKMTEYQINSGYISLIIDWRAFYMGSGSPNRDAPLNYYLFIEKRNASYCINKYQPRMDLIVEPYLVNGRG